MIDSGNSTINDYMDDWGDRVTPAIAATLLDEDGNEYPLQAEIISGTYSLETEDRRWGTFTLIPPSSEFKFEFQNIDGLFYDGGDGEQYIEVGNDCVFQFGLVVPENSADTTLDFTPVDISKGSYRYTEHTSGQIVEDIDNPGTDISFSTFYAGSNLYNSLNELKSYYETNTLAVTNFMPCGVDGAGILSTRGGLGDQVFEESQLTSGYNPPYERSINFTTSAVAENQLYSFCFYSLTTAIDTFAGDGEVDENAYNGLKKFYFSQQSSNDKAGGYIEYYYHHDAWKTASDNASPTNTKFVITHNGSVYRKNFVDTTGTLSSSDLVVRWDGTVGAAGGGSSIEDTERSFPVSRIKYGDGKYGDAPYATSKLWLSQEYQYTGISGRGDVQSIKLSGAPLTDIWCEDLVSSKFYYCGRTSVAGENQLTVPTEQQQNFNVKFLTSFRNSTWDGSAYIDSVIPVGDDNVFYFETPNYQIVEANVQRDLKESVMISAKDRTYRTRNKTYSIQHEQQDGGGVEAHNVVDNGVFSETEALDDDGDKMASIFFEAINGEFVKSSWGFIFPKDGAGVRNDTFNYSIEGLAYSVHVTSEPQSERKYLRIRRGEVNYRELMESFITYLRHLTLRKYIIRMNQETGLIDIIEKSDITGSAQYTIDSENLVSFKNKSEDDNRVKSVIVHNNDTEPKFPESTLELIATINVTDGSEYEAFFPESVRVSILPDSGLTVNVLDQNLDFIKIQRSNSGTGNVAVYGQSLNQRYVSQATLRIYKTDPDGTTHDMGKIYADNSMEDESAVSNNTNSKIIIRNEENFVLQDYGTQRTSTNQNFINARVYDQFEDGANFTIISSDASGTSATVRVDGTAFQNIANGTTINTLAVAANQRSVTFSSDSGFNSMVVTTGAFTPSSADRVIYTVTVGGENRQYLHEIDSVSTIGSNHTLTTAGVCVPERLMLIMDSDYNPIGTVEVTTYGATTITGEIIDGTVTGYDNLCINWYANRDIDNRNIDSLTVATNGTTVTISLESDYVPGSHSVSSVLVSDQAVSYGVIEKTEPHPDDSSDTLATISGLSGLFGGSTNRIEVIRQKPRLYVQRDLNFGIYQDYAGYEYNALYYDTSADNVLMTPFLSDNNEVPLTLNPTNESAYDASVGLYFSEIIGAAEDAISGDDVLLGVFYISRSSNTTYFYFSNVTPCKRFSRGVYATGVSDIDATGVIATQEKGIKEFMYFDGVVNETYRFYDLAEKTDFSTTNTGASIFFRNIICAGDVDCEGVATQVLDYYKDIVGQYEIHIKYQPRLEINDIVEYDGDKYLITGISHDFEKAISKLITAREAR